MAHLETGRWRIVDKVRCIVHEHAWSPDSKFLYFRGEELNSKTMFIHTYYSKWHLYRVDVRTKVQERLWEDQGMGAVPSPDGNHVAAVLYRGGKDGLYVSNLDGTDARRVPTGEGSPGYFYWSPQGDRLLVIMSSDDREKRWDLEARLVTIGEPGVRKIADLQVPFPYLSWSPDGQRIVYGRSGRIYVTDVESGTETDVGEGEYPAWSP